MTEPDLASCTWLVELTAVEPKSMPRAAPARFEHLLINAKDFDGQAAFELGQVERSAEPHLAEGGVAPLKTQGQLFDVGGDVAIQAAVEGGGLGQGAFRAGDLQPEVAPGQIGFEVGGQGQVEIAAQFGLDQGIGAGRRGCFAPGCQHSA